MANQFLDLSSLNGSNGFVLNGIDSGDRSGRSVSNAGDVNGDGIDDLVIGADGASPNGNGSAGESYVVFGASGGFAPSLDLSNLDGNNGFVLNGIDEDEYSGRSVSSAGDVNGDGFADLLIGADSASPNGNGSAGESYVVFGASGDFAPSLELSNLNGNNGFVLNGIDRNDRSGISVSNAGDVNGDGFDDLIIGAISADPNGNDFAGESYVVFGASGGFAPSLELSNLDGTNGFVLNGIDEFDSSGISVSNAGDVNGDGFDDVIIGARSADPNGTTRAGESYVVFGTDNQVPILDFNGIESGVNDAVEETFLGTTLNLIDSNNLFINDDSGILTGMTITLKDAEDGLSELLTVDARGTNITANYQPITGVLSLSGTDSVINYLLVLESLQYRNRANPPIGTSRTIEIIADDGENSFNLSQTATLTFDIGQAPTQIGLLGGFVVNGSNSYDSSGNIVSGSVNVTGGGDINGDGFDDLIGTDFSESYTYYNDYIYYPISRAENYLIFGSNTDFAPTLDLSNLDRSKGFVFESVYSTQTSADSSISNAGDINGDGFDDVITSTSFATDYNGFSLYGDASVFLGSNNGFSEVDSLFSFSPYSYEYDEISGPFSVSGAGDVNGDGFDDVIVSSYYEQESYVLFGSNSGFDSDVSDFDGTNGFTFNRSGRSLSSAGDVNGDGFADIIIGDGFADPNGNRWAGESYVIFGNSGGFAGSLELSDLDGNNGFVINGIDEGDTLGRSVSSAGDVNDDGFDDLIIGASGARESYVVFGSNGSFGANFELSDLNGTNGFLLKGAGSSVSHAGDVNGDGIDDIIIGRSDSSYVVFGSDSGFGTNFELSDLDGNNGFIIDQGGSVSGAGDVNGDGFDDITIGRYVLFGRSKFTSSIKVDPITTNTADVKENSADGTIISQLVTEDQNEEDSHTYTLLDDAGGRFAIDDNQLIVANGSLLDFEEATSHTIRVRTTDNLGLSFEQELTIEVTNVVETLTIAEYGKVSVNHTETTIDLNHNFINPVVFALTPSFNAGQFGNIRITEIENSDNDSFTLKFQEGDYLDGWHGLENVSYLVLEAGNWILDDGTTLEVGTINSNTNSWTSVNFNNPFPSSPAVFTQVQTTNDSDFVTTRQRNTDENGFELTLQEEQANNSGNIGETVGYFAMETGTGLWNDNSYEVGVTDDVLTHNESLVEFESGLFSETPNLFASLATTDGGDTSVLRYDNLTATGVGLTVQEEQSFDEEINHITEQASIFAIEGTGLLSARELVQTQEIVSVTSINDSSTSPNPNILTAESSTATGNTAPILDLNGIESGVDEIVDETFLGTTLNLIDSNNLFINDDSGILTGMTITLKDAEDGLSELLTVDARGTNITANYQPQTGVLSLSGTDSVINYLLVLESLQYRNRANPPTGKSRTIEMVADDGENSLNLSQTATLTFDIAQAPTQIGLLGGGFVVNRSNSDNFLGNIISSPGNITGGGDINGDGFDDLIGTDISTNYIPISYDGFYYGEYGSSRSQKYVIFGSNGDFAPALDLSDLDGSKGFVFQEISKPQKMYSSISNAGDINGDGFDDIIASDIYYNDYLSLNRYGSVDVFFGSNSGFSSRISLSGLDYGASSVSGAGDVNGDGFDDVIVSSDYTYTQESYILFGSNSPLDFDVSDLDGTNGFTFNGLGDSVSGAGDINGDGFDDIIIGNDDSFYNYPNGHVLAGESYVVFGSNGGFLPSLDPSDLDGSNGFVINDAVGNSVSGAGDVNGDGIDDIIIGASRARESYVVFGSDSGFGANFELSDLNGTNGFLLKGAGSSVSGAGDVNGDGIDDIIIGGSDSSYVVFGSNGSFGTNFELSDLDGNNGFIIDQGGSVSGAGDVNGDGFDDITIGSSNSYVVFGRSQFTPSIELDNLTSNTPNVNENSANGTIISQLVTEDPNLEDSHTYTLLDDAGGRFAIDDDQLIVANGSLLDFEEATSHTIRVRTTDNLGLSFEQELTIEVNDVVETLTIAEYGQVSVNHEGLTVNLSHNFINPVVFALTPSFKGGQFGNIRITEIQNSDNDSFTLKFQEGDYLDGFHALEDVSYLVLEAGNWILDDGTTLEVGTINSNTSSWTPVNFNDPFPSSPAVFTQVQTTNDSDFVTTRQRNTDENGFELKLQEEQANTSGNTGETVGFFAIETGTGLWNDNPYQVAITDDVLNHESSLVEFESNLFNETPNLFASLATTYGIDPSVLRYDNLTATGVGLTVQEEQSFDEEINHITEQASIFAIGGSGLLSGTQVL